MKRYTPPKETLYLWQFRLFCVTLVLCIAVAWFMLFSVWFLIAVAAAAALFAAVAFLYLPRLHKSYSISVSESAVIVSSGVIFKTEHIMPFVRTIYTARVTSPAAHALGLCAVVLRAARSALVLAEFKSADIDEIISVLNKD